MRDRDLRMEQAVLRDQAARWRWLLDAGAGVTVSEDGVVGLWVGLGETRDMPIWAEALLRDPGLITAPEHLERLVDEIRLQDDPHPESAAS